MKTLLIVYHSMTGGTLQMAQAAAQGAMSEAAVTVRLLPASQADADDMLTADGYLFATPEYLAAISGVLKDFFDRSYYPVLDRVNGRPYGLMVCAGSDGSNAVRQIERIVTGWRLRPVAEPLIVCTRAQTAAEIMRPKQIDAAERALPRVGCGNGKRSGYGGVLKRRRPAACVQHRRQPGLGRRGQAAQPAATRRNQP
jgi:multimeric flavodoxin WrbA